MRECEKWLILLLLLGGLVIERLLDNALAEVAWLVYPLPMTFTDDPTGLTGEEAVVDGVAVSIQGAGRGWASARAWPGEALPSGVPREIRETRNAQFAAEVAGRRGRAAADDLQEANKPMTPKMTARQAKALLAARTARELEQDRLNTGLDLLEDLYGLRAQLFAPAVKKIVKAVGIGRGEQELEVVTVHYDVCPVEDQAKLVAAMGVLVDKFQVLTGGATSRVGEEVRTREDLEARLSMIRDEVGERRKLREMIDSGTDEAGVEATGSEA